MTGNIPSDRHAYYTAAMPPHVLRTIVIGTVVVIGLTAGTIIINTREAPADTDGGSASSETSAFSASSSSSSPCTEESSESSLSSADGSSASSSAPDIDPCLGISMEELWRETSSAIPDPTKPPLKNILTDTRLKGSFPIRITTAFDGGKTIYEFADPDTWRMLSDEDGMEVVHINGRMFMNMRGEGWITSDASFDEGMSFLNIMGMFSLLLDDPESLGLESIGREPCFVATGKECDVFLRSSPESFRAWSHTDTRFLDHWESGGDSLDVAYGVTINPLSQPASFRDMDEEMREMMRMNGVSDF